MGGIGSGRRYQGGRDTTEDYRTLDVRRLQRDGALKPGDAYLWRWLRNGETVASILVQPEADRVILKYRHQRASADWQPQEYPVRLDWTGCAIGGRRVWFRCPGQGCGRRVAVLYMGGPIFACRHCHRLAYASQRENHDDRATRRADRIRDRLGWTPGILNGSGTKPKGMRWPTYERLTREHDVHVQVTLAGMSRRLGLVNRSLDGIRKRLGTGD
jgi:hypothetical protein